MDTLARLTDVSEQHDSDGSPAVAHNPDLAVRYARRVIEIVDGRAASDAAVTGARR